MTGPASLGTRVVSDVRSAAVPGEAVIVARSHRTTTIRALELLRCRGWRVIDVSDLDHARWICAVRDPSLVLVLDDEPAWLTACVTATRAGTAGAIVVLGNPSTSGVVAALNAGADVVLPDGLPAEDLAARLSAVLRRSSPEQVLRGQYLVAQDLRVDLRAKVVERDGLTVSVSPMEYRLLVYLMKHAGQTLTVQQIVHEVWRWNDDNGSGVNTVRLSIGRVRRKLGDGPGTARFIRSVRGHGYCFWPDVTSASDRVGRCETVEPHLLSAVARVAGALTERRAVAESAALVVQCVVSDGIADTAVVVQLGDRGPYVSAIAGAPMDDAVLRQALARSRQAAGAMTRHSSVVCSAADLVALNDAAGAIRDTPAWTSASWFPLIAAGETWGALGLLSAGRHRPSELTSFGDAAAALLAMTLTTTQGPRAAHYPETMLASRPGGLIADHRRRLAPGTWSTAHAADRDLV